MADRHSASNRKSFAARGCLFGIVLLIGCCYIWPHTDAYERFNGSTLWRGTHTLQVTGDTTFEWKDGSASVSRIAAMAAEDGYHIELHGLRAYELVGFSTAPRPHEGTFPVVKYRRLVPSEGPVFTAMLSLSNNADDIHVSDSGQVTLQRAGKGFQGKYTVYMTEHSRIDSTKSRYLVLRGTFTIR
jgi:hypothetical protein